MHTPSSHMNCESYHKFNQWNSQLCEMREYAFMVLQKYSIFFGRELCVLKSVHCACNYGYVYDCEENYCKQICNENNYGL